MLKNLLKQNNNNKKKKKKKKKKNNMRILGLSVTGPNMIEWRHPKLALLLTFDWGLSPSLYKIDNTVFTLNIRTL